MPQDAFNQILIYLSALFLSKVDTASCTLYLLITDISFITSVVNEMSILTVVDPSKFMINEIKIYACGICSK